MTAAALATGYAADRLLGDPERWHPVAGFGRAAQLAERRMYGPGRLPGAAFAALLITGATLFGELLARIAGRRAALAAIVWAALGGRSLERIARSIAALLDAGDVDGARAALPALAGRDAASLDASGICRAVVESVAENTGDAVAGPLFWGAVAGPAGVAAYRAANTLDAMVGHRSARYEQFGWAAARLDDMLSWPAARAGALATVACAPLAGGSSAGALRVMRRDGAAHPSPNAGRLEAAFAGALGLRLGGPLSYGGRVEDRPLLGDGRAPDPDAVRHAARLSMLSGIALAAAATAARALAEGGFSGRSRR
jgi:adenosylcobinamide-phosphate synthase